MPTYSYRCLDCGYQVEYFQSITEPPRSECPKCKGHLAREVTGGAGLIFKGSGFYITDYKQHHSTGGDGVAKSKRDAPQPETAAPKTEKAAPVAKDD